MPSQRWAAQTEIRMLSEFRKVIQETGREFAESIALPSGFLSNVLTSEGLRIGFVKLSSSWSESSVLRHSYAGHGMKPDLPRFRTWRPRLNSWELSNLTKHQTSRSNA